MPLFSCDISSGDKEPFSGTGCIVMGAILLAALMFRLLISRYHTVMVPDYDGYQFIHIARAIRNGILPPEASNWNPLFPLLLAPLFSLPFPHDVIGTGVNILIGTLTTIPVFYLGRLLFGRSAGICAAAFYAFNPLVAYNNVLVMTETVYTATILLAGCVAVRAARLMLTWQSIVLSSISGALMYHCRPEGAIIFFLLCLVTFLSRTEEPLSRRFTGFSVAVVLFMLLIAPYVCFTRSVTGSQHLSGKAGPTLNQLKQVLQVTGDAGLLTVYLKNPTGSLKLIGQNLALLAGIGRDWFLISLIPLFAFPLAAKTNRLERPVFPYFLFAALAMPLVVNVLYVMDSRYIAPSVAVMSSAAGVATLALAPVRYRRKITVVIIVAFLAMVAGIFSIYRYFEIDGNKLLNEYNTRQLRTTGEWLRRNSPAESVIFGTNPDYIAGYYADREFSVLSYPLEPAKMLSMMKTRPNAFLFINELGVKKLGDYGRSPFQSDYMALMNPTSSVFGRSVFSGKLVPVYVDRDVYVMIYRFVGY